MSALLTVALVVLAGCAYLFVGAVAGGLAMGAGERFDGADKFVWLTAWPVWLAAMAVFALTERGFELGKRLNPELRAELRAAAARELARTIEKMERENQIKLPTGELAAVRPTYSVTDKHAPRSPTEPRSSTDRTTGLTWCEKHRSYVVACNHVNVLAWRERAR